MIRPETSYFCDGAFLSVRLVLQIVRALYIGGKRFGERKLTEKQRRAKHARELATSFIFFLILVAALSAFVSYLNEPSTMERIESGSVPPYIIKVDSRPTTRNDAVAQALGSPSLSWQPTDRSNQLTKRAFTLQGNVILDSVFKNPNGVETHLVAVSSTTPDPKDNQCASCGVLLSGFLFEVEEGRWKLVGSSPTLSYAGKFGHHPSVPSIRLGSHTEALIVNESKEDDPELQVMTIYASRGSPYQLSINYNTDSPFNPVLSFSYLSTRHSISGERNSSKEVDFIYRMISSSKDFEDIELNQFVIPEEQVPDRTALKRCVMGRTHYECTSLLDTNALSETIR